MNVVNYFILYWKPFVWSLILTVVLCLSNQLFVLPIGGVYLIAYVVAVCVSTTWISFVAFQNFLQQTKPLNIKLKSDETGYEPDFSSLSKIALDIDEHFIKKWFVYISNDETFSVESRAILEEVLKKMVKVQLSIDNETVIHGVFNLYLKHLKEFRRGLKRKEKYGGKISELYRYSHTCSDSSKAKDYFIHQLTISLLNHFINWELSNSLPYQVLVSIISRKVVRYLLNLLSNPEFLNYYILNLCASHTKKIELNLDRYTRVKIINDSNDDTSLVDSLETVVNKEEPKEPVAVGRVDTKTREVGGSSRDEVDVAAPAKVSKERTVYPVPARYEDLKSEEVKIYEPKSCKTWYDSYDLESVTLGQDILDMIGESDKDTDTAADVEKEEMSPLSSAKSLLDEMKHITTIEGIKTSMKPISDATLHNFKDFQESTVNNVMKPMSHATSTAFHKIGGLHLQDEAAGVVEGLLDFGRTKIRKGLRLTGLQDDVADETPLLKQTQAQKLKITKMPHVKSVEKSEDLETTWLNPLQEDSAKSDAGSQKVPSILTQSHDEGSPDPEYEEAADLASTIAKLRSLLEQKSSESTLSTPALSPMPPDEFSNKLLLEGVDEGDGVMPSFYKFCAKTATGVINNTLNTIKTALPGNVADKFDGHEKWLFVESNSTETDLSVRMKKLLSEREVFCTVDTAFEAIDSLAPFQHNEKLRRSCIQFEDELDDFEVKLPVTKALLDIWCELLADSKDTWLSREPVIKSVLLLFGKHIEETIVTRANFYVNYWCVNAKIPAEGKVETIELELDAFVAAVLSGIPDYFKYLVGEETLRNAASLLVSSLQVQKINQDMVMQIFEIICMKLMDGSKRLSPVSA